MRAGHARWRDAGVPAPEKTPESPKDLAPASKLRSSGTSGAQERLQQPIQQRLARPWRPHTRRCTREIASRLVQFSSSLPRSAAVNARQRVVKAGEGGKRCAFRLRQYFAGDCLSPDTRRRRRGRGASARRSSCRHTPGMRQLRQRRREGKITRKTGSSEMHNYVQTCGGLG